MKVVALLLCLLAFGCSKKEETKDECRRGELKMPANTASQMATQGVDAVGECPQYLDSAGSAPPIDSWVGAEPYWSPQLVVKLNREKSAADAKKDDGAVCWFEWSLNCR